LCPRGSIGGDLWRKRLHDRRVRQVAAKQPFETRSVALYRSGRRCQGRKAGCSRAMCATQSVAQQRPMAGPVVPLTATSVSAEELLGGSQARPAPTTNGMATPVLTKGEPVSAPSGRADDFSWPRGGPDSADPAAAEPLPARTLVTVPTATPAKPVRATERTPITVMHGLRLAPLCRPHPQGRRAIKTVGECRECHYTLALRAAIIPQMTSTMIAPTAGGRARDQIQPLRRKRQ
jgi:hypothetical protein